MAKTFSVKLEIEEIALGTVLRKLHDMPGIARLDLDFGEGGKGAGKEKLQQAAAEMGTRPEDAVLKALAGGPMKSRDLINATGLRDHRVYYAIGKLGLKKNDQGFYQVEALPKPAVSRGPGGRAVAGAGPAVLRVALSSAGGPLQRKEITRILAGHGMSERSVSGVIDRAKRDGLIKGSKDGYVLTAKAEKMNGEAHG